MKRLALLTAVFGLVAAFAQTTLDSASLYVSDPLKWERGVRPGQPAQRYALGSVLVLEPDGKLAALSCYLYRTPDKRLHIIYSEGFGLSSGTWKNVGDASLGVRLRSIHGGIRKVGAAEEAYREELWSRGPSRVGKRAPDWIKIGRDSYVPLREFSDLKELAEVIEFYRKEADAAK